MTESALVGLAGIIVLGIAAQWLAWRLQLPSILLLLIFGFAAGPLTGLIDPDAMFGELLFPIVSLSVAVILFEGGLNLKMAELKKIRRVVRNLVTLGALVTWIVAAAAARIFLGLTVSLSVLLGAILIVTGPTVILPLLRHVRPSVRVGSILKWEGIVIDPIGAVVALLAFEAIQSGRAGQVTALAVTGLLKTVFVSGAIGLAGAAVVVVFFQRYWIPDFLHNPASLAVIFFSFVAANQVQPESGLLTVTFMGVILGNQKWVPVRHIVEFKENLGVLLISGLFILLAARLRVEDLNVIGWGIAAFMAVIIFVGRPLSVVLSTVGSDLTRPERIFLSWMAPRGIVAAAVASVFAHPLAAAGFEQAERLVPLTFAVIIGTVAVYGLTAGPAARWLGVAHPHAQGALIVGANKVARVIGGALKGEGIRVLLVDTNRVNVAAARMEGLEVYHGNVLSETFTDEAQIEGIGRILAMTPNDEVNALAVLHCADCFERSELYQLCSCVNDQSSAGKFPQHLRGRLLFGSGMNYEHLSKLLAGGAVIKKTRIGEEFNFKDYQDMYGDRALMLFLVGKDRSLSVATVEKRLEPAAGETLISLVAAE